MSDCIFCKIIDGLIPSNIIYENEHILVFEDVNPQTPTHLLIIPREHIPTTLDITEEQGKEIMPKIFSAIGYLARKFNLEQEGFRIVNNCGSNGGQTVNHLHFHLLGGRQLNWPPG